MDDWKLTQKMHTPPRIKTEDENTKLFINFCNRNVENFDVEMATVEDWQRQLRIRWTKRRHLWIEVRKYIDKNFVEDGDCVGYSDDDSSRLFIGLFCIFFISLLEN